METINDSLCFLNGLEFFDLMKNDLIEKFKLTKQRLVNELKDHNGSGLVSVLNITDDIIISILINKLEDFAEKNDTLQKNILYLDSFEYFIEKDGKSN